MVNKRSEKKDAAPVPAGKAAELERRRQRLAECVTYHKQRLKDAKVPPWLREHSERRLERLAELQAKFDAAP